MTSVLQQRKIEIPYGEGDEVLELEVSNLPEPQESVGILTDQDCKIGHWIMLALEYYRQRNFDAFELLLTTCLTHWNLDRVKREAETHPNLEDDRVKALDLLAIYYVRKALQTKERETKRDFSTRATQKFTEVDKTGISNQFGSVYQTHLMGRAYHCMMIEGRSEQAEQTFNFLLTQQQQSGEPDNVAPLLGKAMIEFNKKETSGKRAALNYYKKALQLCPNCPADVRLGMGLCFYRLNMIDKAELAFKRALSIDPQCVGAITGLAVIELNKKIIESIKRGIEYLSRAFKIEPTNSMVLTLLADHFFYSNEHGKVIKLATRAMENTDNEAMQAQACYQLGRAYHKMKDYVNAFEYYYKATTFAGNQFFLAQYGLGQMYIQRCEFDHAIEAFERVLETNNENIETLKILASLYARYNPNKRETAKEYLKKVTQARPDDVESWVELASLCEQNDTQAALTAYRRSIELYEAKSQPVPAEIYNNIACLLFSLEQLEESEKFYSLAKQRCEEESSNNRAHHDSIKYTIEYNTGRLLEANHELIKADATYKKILIDHPKYIDCYLRLGCMARDRGLISDASDRYKDTAMMVAGNVGDGALAAWTLLGNLHFSKGEYIPCQKKFEMILKKNQENPDIYSLISVGNVLLQLHYHTSRADKLKIAEQRKKAIAFFSNALKRDQRNIYAANGIGCMFAVKNMFNEARDIFSQVREATADFPDVWINIAHIYVEQKQYAAAVQMYENCLKKFYNNSNTEILLYIARAQFKANKLADCKKVLIRARHLCPHDIVILINLAKLLKTYARQVFEDRKSTYLQVVAAEYELRLARQYFQAYVSLKEQKSVNDRSLIDSTIVGVEEQDCADLLLQVEKSIKADAEQRDREEALRRERHEEQLRLELARKAEEEEKRVKEEQAKKDEQENKRRELLKKQEEAKQKLLDEAHSGVVNDDGSDDGGSRRKKQKTKRKEKSEKDRDGDRQEKERPAESKKYKSKAILSSDSSSSSSDDEGIL